MKRIVPAVLLGAAASAVPGIRRAFRRDLAAARRRLDHPGETIRDVETSAGTVRSAEGGPSAGRPVLILHGNNGGWDQSADWAHRRLGDDVRWLAPSRFGYPGSVMPANATPALQADVLAELLDRLEVPSADVVSLSAGSITAAHLALRHPGKVRQLILESPVLPTRKPLRQPPRPVFERILRAEFLFWITSRLPAAVAQGSGLSWRSMPAAERSELREIMRTLTPVENRSAGMVFDNLDAYAEIARDTIPWEQITVPVTVVAARDSPLPTQEDVARFGERLQHARIVSLPRGGHLILGNVEALRRIYAEFLSD